MLKSTRPRKQPFGNKSKQSLSDLCFNKTATLVDKGKDRYKRTLARVHCDGVDANAEQIRRGMAWVYDRYVTDRSLYQLQDEAKAERRGLWADPVPVPPWVWRKTGGQKAGPEGCVIKGNINSKGEKIYHVPSRSSYAATRIDESKGERWFCTEEQAEAAGWRAPRQ